MRVLDGAAGVRQERQPDLVSLLSCQSTALVHLLHLLPLPQQNSHVLLLQAGLYVRPQNLTNKSKNIPENSFLSPTKTQPCLDAGAGVVLVVELAGVVAQQEGGGERGSQREGQCQPRAQAVDCEEAGARAGHQAGPQAHHRAGQARQAGEQQQQRAEQQVRGEEGEEVGLQWVSQAGLQSCSPADLTW